MNTKINSFFYSTDLLRQLVILPGNDNCKAVLVLDLHFLSSQEIV